MNRPLLAVSAGVAAVITLAACGGSAGHPAATAPAAAHSAHASPAASLPSMTIAQEDQECAALAMVRGGDDTYANQVAVMAGQYQVSQHLAAAMIARTVRDRCQSMVSVLP